MLRLRQVLFAVWLYGSILLIGLVCAPLLISRQGARNAVAAWGRVILFGLKAIMGIRVQVRGRDFAPRGAAIVAGKHQSMLDVIIPFLIMPDPCFVLKEELMRLPVVGWYAGALRMIPVRREAQAAALKHMVAEARRLMGGRRQLLIFPEGTRTEPGAPPAYKPGVAAIYRELDLPVVPMATNSGMHWPASGIGFRPGVVVFEFLEAIPAGLKRPEFMRELEGRLELASAGLLAERL